MEAHSQNLLFVMQGSAKLTGEIVLRDLADSTIHLALRLAKGKPCPAPPLGLLPKEVPFSIVANAADHRNNFGRRELRRGSDVVETYGLWGFVWPLQEFLRRFFGDYDRARVERAFGGCAGATLPDSAEPLRIVPGLRRRRGPVHERLESTWGDLYLRDGLPSHFRPAF